MDLLTSSRHVWTRILNWLSTQHPDEDDISPDSADDHALRRLENALGLDLDERLCASLRVVNGFDRFGVLPSPDPLMPVPFAPLSDEEILAEWSVWSDLIAAGEFEGLEVEADPQIDECWWKTDWIPFAGNGSGDFLCIDMAPSQHGQVGQVIAAWHDDPQRQLLASDLLTYLEQVADAMEDDQYEFDELEGVFGPVT